MVLKYVKLKYIKTHLNICRVSGAGTACEETSPSVEELLQQSLLSAQCDQVFVTFFLQFSYLFYLWCTLFTLFALSTSNWFRPNLIPTPISFHLLPSQHSPDRPRLLLLPPALWSKVSQAILSSHSQTQSDIQVRQDLYFYLYLYLNYKW